MRRVINYCVLVFCLEFVASFPFPEEYIAYEPNHATVGGITHPQNGQSNPPYQNFRQHYNNLGYQAAPSFARTAPRNIPYSHVEYPSRANAISNSAYHEMIAQQRQNYENIIRNQQQEQIKGQQVAVLNERLANQLRIQPQVQPHYPSNQPLLNTVAEPYLNSVPITNPYQHNFESVKEVTSGVPQYFQIDQQLPLVNSPVQRPFAESNVQNGHNIPIQIEEVNHEVNTAPINSQIQHSYNQWPNSFQTAPGNNVHHILAQYPNIRDLISTTTQRKRYMVIHPNGTVEHVDTLEPVAQRHPNYVLVNAGQISQNSGALGHYPQSSGITYPNTPVPPYANLVTNTEEPINIPKNILPPDRTPAPNAAVVPEAPEYLPELTAPEAPETPDSHLASAPLPTPIAPAAPATTRETTAPISTSPSAASETTTPAPPITQTAPTTQSKPAGLATPAPPAKSGGLAPPHPAKPTVPTTPTTTAKPTASTAKQAASVIPTTTIASTPKTAAPAKTDVPNKPSETVNKPEASTPTTSAIPTKSIDVASSANESKPAPAIKPANLTDPVTSATSLAPATPTTPDTPATLTKPTTPATPTKPTAPVTVAKAAATATSNDSASDKPTTPGTPVAPAKSALKTPSAPTTTTPVTPAVPAKSSDPTKLTTPSTPATSAKPVIPDSPKKSPESSSKTTPKATTASAKADSSSKNASAVAKSPKSSTKTAESNENGTTVAKSSFNPLGIDFTKVKASAKPVMWFRSTDVDAWSKLMADDEINVVYFLQVPPQPKIEKDSKTTVFSNGTIIEEITETVWDDESDEPKVTKTTKVINQDDKH